MIRAIARNADNPIVLLGLHAENLSGLQSGRPIRINLRTLTSSITTDLPNVDVVLFFADDAAERLLR